jgi:hypothetical protein
MCSQHVCQEIENEERVKQLSRSFQELRDENAALQNVIEQREAVIAELNKTIGGTLSSQDLGVLDEMCSHGKVLLSEELASQDNKYIPTKGAETKKDTPTASEERRGLVIFSGTGLEINYRSLITGGRKYLWELLFIKFVDISEKTAFWAYYICAGVGLLVAISASFFLRHWMLGDDDAVVNAWWYLKEKIDMNNHRL